MDILHLVDRLEELFNESRPIWLTHSVIVDEDRMLDLIDQMRVAIPEEIKKAQQIIAQRDRILAQAKEEANRTIALAREKADKTLEDNEIIQAAKMRADEIINQSQQDAESSQREADKYIFETLTGLELHLDRMITQVRNGIKTLQDEIYTLDQN
ncbi:MAG: ATP synthase F0 subunit B [Chloroflexi bacterium]|nr:ATP synthase F0 subunit B [Chloroflexota bacterium]